MENDDLHENVSTASPIGFPANPEGLSVSIRARVFHLAPKVATTNRCSEPRFAKHHELANLLANLDQHAIVVHANLVIPNVR